MFKSNYKWFILALALLAYGIIVGAERLSLPVLFKEISLDLNLSMVSIGTIWGMDPLAGVFISIPAGLLADRFGIKRTLVVACILSGVFCALRGFSTNFATMAASMFLFGLMATIIFTIAPKVTAVWFSGKNLSLANAMITVSRSVFSMSATMLSATVISPWLGGWRNTLFFLGAPAILVGVLWWILGREPRPGEIPEAAPHGVPFKQAIKHVVRIKEVWIFGLLMITFMGPLTSLNGYLAIYLRDLGWSTLAADTALTANSAAGIVGIIPMIMLANRLQAPRGVFIFTMTVLVVSLAVIPFVNGMAMWILLISSGLLRSAGQALCNTLIFRIKGVGGSYAGTAMGVATSIGMLGSFAAPPLGNRLAEIQPGMPFLFWALLAACSFPLFLSLRQKKSGPTTSTAAG